MWANFVCEVTVSAFFVAVGMPIELYGDCGTITSQGDKKLLEVQLDSERGRESIYTLIIFIA